ncbi:NDP-hexose 2,3-dehydratase [Streptomyces griseoflavus]|uniref:NDP-hexose 2,3-dehydratase family protein n=1 Tax=Streptomyces rimosus TaxID=1927 RepID=UPI00067A7D4F|nr:NDP-hexose 2,3-dehydratase family protein [Streptomyces rimosus]KOG65995.1 NDP-hexose 2,3-dehydratase [Streptomyces griseoflavus]
MAASVSTAMPAPVADRVVPGALGRWFAEAGERAYTRTRRIPLDALEGWHTDAHTGDLVHDRGSFFSVGGLDVTAPDGPVPRWAQPVLHQPETGILGLLVKDFGGVPHYLMQAKPEPGNAGGLQLAPTVQATRSNFTRAHGGLAVPYLRHFRSPSPRALIADVRQSEQGAWFYRKRNRNMIVRTTEDVPVLPGHRWMTLPQIHGLLAAGDVVNMDARSVLACLPPRPGPAGRPRHTGREILCWLTDVRSRPGLRTRPVPLRGLPGWHRTEHVIRHDDGRFFEIIAVEVRAGGREVRRWTQPMLRPCGTGVIAFLHTRIDGVPHVLVHAAAEPGGVDAAELTATVCCTPQNYAGLPPAARPRFLDEVRDAPPGRVLFDALLSEEGGRFHHALNRYRIVAVDGPRAYETAGDYRWVTVRQLYALLCHSHYVTIQARTLLTCLRSLSGAEAP